MPSMPVSGGQLGWTVAWCLVAETPLEVAAGEAAVGREHLQRQAAWAWPVENGSLARRELGCVAPMLVTKGVTGGH